MVLAHGRFLQGTAVDSDRLLVWIVGHFRLGVKPMNQVK
jgi:hypothetical protein